MAFESKEVIEKNEEKKLSNILIILLAVSIVIVILIFAKAAYFLITDKYESKQNSSQSNIVLECSKLDALDDKCDNYFKTNLTQAECLSLKEPYKDTCIYRMFLINKDLRICNLISNNEMRLICLNEPSYQNTFSQNG